MQCGGKARCPMVAFGDAMVIAVSNKQSPKALFPIFVIVLGKYMLFNDEQPENASHSITDSEFEKVTLVSDSQHRKALSPIVVTELGSVILLSDLHPRKE